VSTLVLSCIGDVDRGKAAAHRCIPSVESNLVALPCEIGRWATVYQPTNGIVSVCFCLLQPVPKVSAAETDPIRKSGKRVVQLGVIAPDTVDEV
jgi:hypothetical protein